MTISVYKILNTKSGKFYVGYSKNTEKRFSSHKNMLRRNEHHCIHLQRAWLLDGEQAFEFSILQKFEKVEDAIQEEQNQLDLHFSKGIMYNSVATNDLKLAIFKAHTREARSKNKLSRRNSQKFQEATAKNRRLAVTPEAIKKRVETGRRNGTLGQSTCKSIIAREEFGAGFTEYKSIAEASRILKISQGNIHSCCTGKRHRAKGYLFCYNIAEAA